MSEAGSSGAGVTAGVGAGGGVTGADAGRPPRAEPAELVGAATGSDTACALEAIRDLRPLIDKWERDQVNRARDAGWTWVQIANRLGRHRQAVHREYALHKPKES